MRLIEGMYVNLDGADVVKYFYLAFNNIVRGGDVQVLKAYCRNTHKTSIGNAKLLQVIIVVRSIIS